MPGFSRLLDYLLVSVALAVLAFTCYAFSVSYFPAPFADSYNVFQTLSAAGYRITLPSLIKFHSEHRPLFARLPIIVDLLWFGGANWLPFALIFLIQAAQTGILVAISRRQSWFDPKRDKLWILALAIFVAFSPAQMENFLWVFQVAFLLNFAFVAVALASVAWTKEKPGFWPALATCVCAFGAPLCLASGVLVWGAVILAAVLIRLPWKWIAGYCAAILLTVVLYFQGYTTPRYHSDPLQSIQSPLTVLHYVVYYFGASWKWWTIEFGELLAIAVVIFLGWRLLSAARRTPMNPWDVVPLASMVFLLAGALITGLGRLRFGLEQAGSSRYQTASLLFWFMAALIVYPELLNRSPRWRIAFPVALLVAMTSLFAALPGTLDKLNHIRQICDAAQAAWVSGVPDTKTIVGTLFVDPNETRDELLERRLGAFASGPGAEIGKLIATGRIQPPLACRGTFVREELFDNGKHRGIRMGGSGVRVSPDSGQTKPIRWYLITDEEHRVVGIGSETALYAGGPGITMTTPLLVYGILDNDELCPIELLPPRSK